MSNTFMFCFLSGVRPYMAINNESVQYNNDGFFPDIILLTQCYSHRGTRLNAMKRFCICSIRYNPSFFPLAGDAQKV